MDGPETASDVGGPACSLITAGKSFLILALIGKLRLWRLLIELGQWACQIHYHGDITTEGFANCNRMVFRKTRQCLHHLHPEMVF